MARAWKIEFKINGTNDEYYLHSNGDVEIVSMPAVGSFRKKIDSLEISEYIINWMKKYGYEKCEIDKL